MSLVPIGFGIPSEWETFLKTHPVLIQKLNLLFNTFHKVFIREVRTEESADRVVFFLGRLCIEDFMEILLLCGNGYGVGGLKLLRGLYERAVTAGCIAKNPTEAEVFLEYHYINEGKLFNHAKELFDMNKHLSPEKIKQIQSSYEKVKGKYEEPICKKCGTYRPRFSWSELDILSMARKAGFEKLYLTCYYEPTLQAHATVSSLIARMVETKNGGLSFDEGAQRERGSQALVRAHDIILRVLGTQNEYFKLNLDSEISELIADFKSIWERG
jgi:hypothetical protein